MSTRLSSAARQRAVDYVYEHGTDLHRARYRFHFADGTADEVLVALAAYRNEDGGFGYGLEPDLRTGNSSVIATTVALQIVARVGAGDSPLTRRALAWLDSQYQQDNWPLISADCNDAPHAPWWHYDPDWAGGGEFLPNPGAEVLSHYLTFDHRPDELPPLLDRAAAHLRNADLEMHELLCYLRLVENPKLAAVRREAMTPAIMREARKLVRTDPSDWEEYGLPPLSVVDSPDCLLAPVFADALDANLDYHIAHQQEEGHWPPAWSWGGEFPETWAEVEAEISAELTLQTLIKLDRFDRMQPLPGTV